MRTYEHFASRDQLSRVVLERMLAGVSTRRYRRLQEPVGEEVEQAARSTSKSAVSRTFVARTREALMELMARRLEDVRLAVLMIDGIGLKDHTCVVALGITTDGVKLPLGLWEGSTENKTVATELLVQPRAPRARCRAGRAGRDRRLQGPPGRRQGRPRDAHPVQRCTCHKERN